MPDGSLRYGIPLVVLHWLTGVAVIANLTIGLIFADMPHGPETYALFRLHAAVGATALVLAVALVAFRFAAGCRAPRLPTDMPGWMRRAAYASHTLLYLFIVLVPLAGWLLVSTGGHGVPFFGLTVPALPIRGHLWHKVFEIAHVTMACGLLVVVPIHALAALYHQYYRRDGVLARMVPWMKVEA